MTKGLARTLAPEIQVNAIAPGTVLPPPNHSEMDFVSSLENRQGLKIACLEEIALNYNWITKKQIKEAINFYGKCIYSDYLKKLIQ